MTPKQLRDFEIEIQRIYELGDIKAPIHLRNNNEADLCSIFKNVRKKDYVFSTWASHLHALLKGIPPEAVKKKILDGKSITLHFPEHNFYSSAIVGGICPIATGVAWSLKERDSDDRVFCLIGDMSFLTGIASESIRFSICHDLPITWVIEDNGVSVGTPTKNVWGDSANLWYTTFKNLGKGCLNWDMTYYRFNMTYPHSGTGTFVEF
jgi:TPP-dependent pyruvate/acetoin dehydrogenase alpha subunit